MATWYKNMEPFRYKLRRWILGEKNLIPKSISESKFQLKSYLGPDFVEEKITLFNSVDQNLFFGVGFHYIYEVFERLGVNFGEDEE